MIEIKTPSLADAPAISALLESLGYPGTHAFIERRVTQMITLPDASLLVAVDSGEVIGVISLHFIPQLALNGDIYRISYLCVSERARGRGVGALLEEHAESLARQRGCDRIELHCHERRTDAHRFYHRQQYLDSPKYLYKSLDDAN
ncbi:GNAT family N-acetyltransferase [Stutzerimonas nitrititolerans]|uniref:GNAT family N-acetyltransferase n=1 Tax=Stutzerimonas nitrititolerans TaxID=2482751 RepID=UPI0028A1C2D4|nr:GNAT family N-acetyltransferase [Stutzerimonas nitrititolerans]